jgi:hypothetical protein
LKIYFPQRSSVFSDPAESSSSVTLLPPGNYYHFSATLIIDPMTFPEAGTVFPARVDIFSAGVWYGIEVSSLSKLFFLFIVLYGFSFNFLLILLHSL